LHFVDILSGIIEYLYKTKS